MTRRYNRNDRFTWTRREVERYGRPEESAYDDHPLSNAEMAHELNREARRVFDSLNDPAAIASPMHAQAYALAITYAHRILELFDRRSADIANRRRAPVLTRHGWILPGPRERHFANRRSEERTMLWDDIKPRRRDA